MILQRTILIITMLFTTQLFADGFRKYAGEFLNIGVGSRALGMAGAYTAVADDITASYWNPAGLVDADGFQAYFMHSKQFIKSVQHNYLGASHTLGEKSTIGVSLLYFTVNSIADSRNARNTADGKFDYSKISRFNVGDYTLLLTYSQWYSEKLSYGINVKTIYRDYHVESAFGLGFDAALKYRLTERLVFGLALRDFTSTMMAWSTGEKEFVTPSLRLGGSYLFDISSLNLSIQPAADVNILFENRRTASQYHLWGVSFDSFLGMEVAYNDLLALRLGMDDLNRFNTGIGLQIPKMIFDYSFTAYQSELGDIHRISFHLKLSELF